MKLHILWTIFFFFGFGPLHVLTHHDKTLFRRSIAYWMLLGSFSSGRLKGIESYEITHMMDNFFLVSGPATSLHIMTTLISHSIDLHAHFPSIGSDDPPSSPPPRHGKCENSGKF